MSQVKAVEKWLTTLDNPFDYWDDHDNWQRYDEDHGYHTIPLIARVAYLSSEMSELEQNEAINEAVEQIYKVNPTGNYRIITKESEFYNDR